MYNYNDKNRNNNQNPNRNNQNQNKNDRTSFNVQNTSPEKTGLNTEITKDITPEKPILGSVANCRKLNVRRAPSKESEVICVIEEGTMVTIVPAHGARFDTDIWANVKLHDGVRGFVMVEFLKEV